LKKLRKQSQVLPEPHGLIL